MTKRIYVGNLPSHTTARDLTSLFEQVGPVVAARIMTDRDTGRSKGFGFVEMGSEEAEKAIRQLNRADLHGRPLAVSEARARPQSAADRSRPPARLFVGNLPYQATEAELKAFFSAVGPVSSVILPVERESGQPRGFAFVDFADPAHAVEAVDRFHDQPFNGRALVVTEARAPESRPPAAFSPRPSPSLRERPAASLLEEGPSRSSGPGRHFSPDAPPRDRKPTPRRPKSERSRGKPIPERKGGQFFGTIEDEPYDKGHTGEHGGSQLRDAESDEQS
jgi:nucleolin